MKILTWLFSLMAFTTVLADAASAQCFAVRHFYNNSDYTWSLSFKGGCHGLPYCTIAPHSVAAIEYSPEIPIPMLPIVVNSRVYSQGFTMRFCYIMHSGNTGAIA